MSNEHSLAGQIRASQLTTQKGLDEVRKQVIDAFVVVQLYVESMTKRHNEQFLEALDTIAKLATEKAELADKLKEVTTTLDKVFAKKIALEEKIQGLEQILAYNS